MDHRMTDVRQYGSSAQTPAATRRRTPPTGLYMPLMSPCVVVAEPQGGVYNIAWIPLFPAQWCPLPPAIFPPYTLLQTQDVYNPHLLTSGSGRVNDQASPLSAKVNNTPQGNIHNPSAGVRPHNPPDHRADIIVLPQQAPYPGAVGDVQKEQKEKLKSPEVPPARPPEGQKSGPTTGLTLPIKKQILQKVRKNHQIQDSDREDKEYRTCKTVKFNPSADPKTLSSLLKEHEKKAKRR